MTDENQEIVHSDEPVEVETTEEETTDSSDEESDEESSESSDELAKAQSKIIDLKRQLKDKGGKSSEDKPKGKSLKAGELDFGQLAFHNSKTDSTKIESEEALEFLKETMDDTGKSQDALLKSKWFMSDLAEKIEKGNKATANKKATPTKSRRSVPTGKDNIDYWLDKPFSDVPQRIRGEVLKRKVADESNPFYSED